jgi:hypothetical protein
MTRGSEPCHPRCNVCSNVANATDFLEYALRRNSTATQRQATPGLIFLDIALQRENRHPFLRFLKHEHVFYARPCDYSQGFS